MNLARMALGCSPERFVEANIEAVMLGEMTRRTVRTAPAEGSMLRRRDSTSFILWNERVLGLPLPRSELQKVLSNTTEATVFVVFGLGTGNLPRALRRISNGPIIVYEPSVGLLRTVLESGPLDLDDVHIVSNPHDLSLVWGRYSGRRRDAVMVNTPGYGAAFPEECAAVPTAVQRLVERVSITKNTYRKRAQTWVSDVLRNVELLVENPLFLALEGAYSGVPAFIVGAGPSLDKNVEQLRQARRKGIVFAANSSALALGKRGIEPHVVCCLESIDISEKLRTIPFLDRVIRAFSLSASPEALRASDGPLLPFYESLPQYCMPLEALTGVPGVNVCGSVSTAAFSLAQRLGCSPIVLVGQDMAFTEGKTYAGGTGYESSQARANHETGRVELDWNDEIQKQHGAQHGTRHDSEPLMEVPAWGGTGRVMSGPSFMAINAWLEATAALSDSLGSERQYVNATEGGAAVAGFVETPLATLLDDLPDRDVTVEHMLSQAHSRVAPKTADAVLDWFSSQAKQTKRVAVQARRVRRFSEHAKRALDTDSPPAINRAFARLDVEERLLKQAVAEAPLVDAWSHAEVDTLVVEHGSSQASDARANAVFAVKLGAQVATAIEQAAKELETHLQSNSLSLAKQATTTKGNSQCR